MTRKKMGNSWSWGLGWTILVGLEGVGSYFRAARDAVAVRLKAAMLEEWTTMS